MHQLDISFRTLVTELGAGTQCVAMQSLRTHFSEQGPEPCIGMGYGNNALSARFAAEGEMRERATWRWGALWNSVHFPDGQCEIPEETKLIMSAKDYTRLSTQPCTAIPVIHQDGRQSWIPSEAVFYMPKLAQDIRHNSATTGWAYHITKEQAAAQGYREVIERDLQMLFWLGKLKPFLKKLPMKLLRQWHTGFALDASKNATIVLQMNVNIARRFGKKAYFTLVLYASDEEPYLSTGSSLKLDAEHSFFNAMGECIMLRSHQHEQFIEGISEASANSYNAHVIRATRETTMRDRIFSLFSEDHNGDALEDPRLDYSRHKYRIAYLQPPPPINHDAVARVWVDGCQNMLPAGFSYGLTKRWQEAWGITEKQWRENRWHPYP